MQRYLKSLLLTSTAIFAFSVQSFGQLQSYETISAFTGSITSFTAGRALIQTFNSSILIDSLTYRFASASNSFAGTTLNAYFTQWNPTTNQVIGSAILSTSISVPSSASFSPFVAPSLAVYNGFDFTFNLNATTQSDLTYAMILVGTAFSPIGLLNIDASDAFVYGDGRSRTGISTSSLSAGFTSLSSAGVTTTPGFDWGFSQISIIAVPEPSTAAAALVAGFVGLMVIRRRLQRTKVQPVTIA